MARASADQTIRVWDAATGAQIFSLTGHTGWVFSIAYSPDSKCLVSASGDKTVRVWDTATGKQSRQPAAGLSLRLRNGVIASIP
jgi:WD40 repeat protein